MKNLCLLDLDHTIIYGTYEPWHKTELLGIFQSNIYIYKRPYLHEFISYISKLCDIIVYTSSKHDYASYIVDTLELKHLKLLSRNTCMWDSENGIYYKRVHSRYLNEYDRIIIVDDSPEVWNSNSSNKLKMFSPRKFYGSEDDFELLTLIEEIKVSFMNI